MQKIPAILAERTIIKKGKKMFWIQEDTRPVLSEADKLELFDTLGAISRCVTHSDLPRLCEQWLDEACELLVQSISSFDCSSSKRSARTSQMVSLLNALQIACLHAISPEQVQRSEDEHGPCYRAKTTLNLGVVASLGICQGKGQCAGLHQPGSFDLAAAADLFAVNPQEVQDLCLLLGKRVAILMPSALDNQSCLHFLLYPTESHLIHSFMFIEAEITEMDILNF